MVKVFTKPAPVEAIVAGDILAKPSAEWATLPRWVVDMFDRGNLAAHPKALALVDINRNVTLLLPDDWLIREETGAISYCRDAEFIQRYYPKEDAPPAPFTVGDIVSLTSGGFAMTVEECRRSCAPGGFLVDVVWGGDAMQAEFSRETLPAACLTGSRSRIDVSDPF